MIGGVTELPPLPDLPLAVDTDSTLEESAGLVLEREIRFGD